MNAYHLAAFPPILLLIAEPTLWPWALAVAAFAALAALGAAAHHFRNERDAALAELARREREHAAQADMEARLTDPATATTVHVPLVRLRSVPAQRDGSEYEWPAIVRAVEGEVEA